MDKQMKKASLVIVVLAIGILAMEYKLHGWDGILVGVVIICLCVLASFVIMKFL